MKIKIFFRQLLLVCVLFILKSIPIFFAKKSEKIYEFTKNPHLKFGKHRIYYGFGLFRLKNKNVTRLLGKIKKAVIFRLPFGFISEL